MRHDPEKLREMAEAAHALHAAARDVKESAFGMGDLLHRAADLGGRGEAAARALKDAAAAREEVLRFLGKLSRVAAEFERNSDDGVLPK